MDELYFENSDVSLVDGNIILDSIQIYCIQTVCKMVPGISRKKHENPSPFLYIAVI